MNGWFLTYLILNFMGVAVVLAKHGEEREEKYNFFISLSAELINLGLLYMAIKTGF